MTVKADDVIWCYRSLLGRAPESPEVVNRLAESEEDLRSLMLLFLRSEEFQARNSRPAPVPLSEGQMDIDDTASRAEFLRLQDRIRATWTHLGETRPHHSV